MFKYNPMVSIVIPAYNASNYLSQAIDSALAQTYENIEIIVVNDGSNDNDATESVVNAYGDKVRYFKIDHKGSSAALNFGIAQMRGEWFSWLSHDDIYTPEKIETQIRFLNSLCDYENHVLFAASSIINGNGQQMRRVNEKTNKNQSIFVESLNGNGALIAEPTKGYFHGCTCLIHKEVLANIGGFNEDLRYVNDKDIWFRIYAKGYKIHYLPQILVKGRIHAQQISHIMGYSYHNSEQDMFWGRSLEWLLENHTDNYEFFLRYGRNAFMKSRNSDGEKAFERAAEIDKSKKAFLALEKFAYKTGSALYRCLKKLYFKIRVR